MAWLRFSAGTARATAPMITPRFVPATPSPTNSPVPTSSCNVLPAADTSEHAAGVEQGRHHQHRARAEAVGQHADERLAQAQMMLCSAIAKLKADVEMPSPVIGCRNRPKR